MKPTISSQPSRHDAALLRNTLLRLTALNKIICVAVVVIVALIAYHLLNRLSAFGQSLDYTGLFALGPQAVTLLQEYNPFFWWGIVILCWLIVAYFLYGFVLSMQRKGRMKLVDEDTIADLSARLSEPAKAVLRWTWRDRAHPITVGDLQRTAQELSQARADKIVLARRHAELLNITPSHDTFATAAAVQQTTRPAEPARGAEPGIASEPIMPPRQEPRLGGTE
ncbi:MAG: hypothetical protein WC284_05835 [Candidimonas sp.]|jgi:hypothetical protein